MAHLRPNCRQHSVAIHALDACEAAACTGDGFDNAFGVLGSVGMYLGALRRHELTNPLHEEKSPFVEASSLALHVGSSLGMAPRFGARNPFPFMDLQDVQEVTNFFERRPSAYQMAVGGEVRFDEAF